MTTMNSMQVQSSRRKPLEDEYLFQILELCVSIYGKAAQIYQELGRNSQGVGISTFWANMSIDINQQALYWKKMEELAKRGLATQTLDKPREAVADLKSIDSQLAVLMNSMPANDEEGIPDAFLLAYAVEFHLLSQTLEVLDGAILRLTKTEVPRKSYKEHLDNFVRGFARQFGSVPHLCLARSLQRMYTLNKSVADYSMLDPTSGVLNRKGLEKSIYPLASLAQRNKYPIAVLMISIDNIDELYDALGCEEGDRVVRSIASGFKPIMRTSDVVGRYDYRAFLLFLPQVKQQFLHDIAERIIETLHTRTPCVFKFSLSVGGAYGALGGGLWKVVEDLVQKAEYCLSRARLLKNQKIVIE